MKQNKNMLCNVMGLHFEAKDSCRFSLHLMHVTIERVTHEKWLFVTRTLMPNNYFVESYTMFINLNLIKINIISIELSIYENEYDRKTMHFDHAKFYNFHFHSTSFSHL